MKYDAIVVGGKFASLGVAKVLKGNILLIDRKPEGGIFFEVTPIDFSFEKPVKFEIKINTYFAL